MKLFPLFRCTFLFLAACLFSVPSYSQWINGIPANLVLGQPDITTIKPGITNDKLFFPQHVIVHPLTKQVFVSDTYNHRVLRFASYDTYQSGDAAEVEIKNTNALGLSYPSGLVIDNLNNLWVADYDNNRILRFPNASNLVSNVTADKVLGQEGLTSTITSGSSLSQMRGPSSLFFDGTTLWVSDTHNHRILRFDNANDKESGAPAEVFFGSTLTTTNARTLNYPSQIFVDKNGALWVADYGFNRVLRFSNAKNLANGPSADLVLGQSSFTINLRGAAPSATQLNSPTGVYGDKDGKIYISDYANHRIMIYNTQTANNVAASNVIGQVDFVTNVTFPTSINLKHPHHLFIDDNLWVADMAHSRALKFVPNTNVPVSLANFKVQRTSNGDIKVEWETLSESNNSHFEIYASTDAKTFEKITTVKSKGLNGNSSEKLNYDYQFNLSQTALAGFSILSLLLMPMFRNRIAIFALIIVTVLSVIACTKDEGKSNTDKSVTTYIKLTQVDNDGTITELGIKEVK